MYHDSMHAMEYIRAIISKTKSKGAKHYIYYHLYFKKKFFETGATGSHL
jgi:hypothetical protein